MNKLHYFLKYTLCVIFISCMWTGLDLILDNKTTTATDVLIVGFALLWSIEKERIKKLGKDDGQTSKESH